MCSKQARKSQVSMSNRWFIRAFRTRSLSLLAQAVANTRTYISAGMKFSIVCRLVFLTHSLCILCWVDVRWPLLLCFGDISLCLCMCIKWCCVHWLERCVCFVNIICHQVTLKKYLEFKMNIDTFVRWKLVEGASIPCRWHGNSTSTMFIRCDWAPFLWKTTPLTTVLSCNLVSAQDDCAHAAAFRRELVICRFHCHLEHTIILCKPSGIIVKRQLLCTWCEVIFHSSITMNW